MSSNGALCADRREQTGQGGRNKGPIPRECLLAYDAPPQRPVPAGER